MAQKVLLYAQLEKLMIGLKGLFVQKEDGKGLSTNDYSAADKANVNTAYQHSQSSHAPSTAERNVIVGVRRNGTVLAVDGSRTVDVQVPIKVSDLTNDSGYVNATQVAQSIATAGHIKKEIVTALPAVSAAQENVIYLKRKAGGAQDSNIYDEYMLIGGAFEHMGDTDTHVDLSDYLKKSDLIPITDAEIEAMLQ